MTSEERRERIRGYVVSNAAQGPEHALSLARGEWQRLADLIGGVTQAEAAFDPGGGDWTVAQVVQHLTLSLQYNYQRIASMAAGVPFLEPPYAAGQLPDEPRPGEPVPPFAEIRESFFAAVDGLGAVVEKAVPDAHLELTAAHVFFGPYNWVQWVVHNSIHVRDHIGQIERTLAAARERGRTVSEVPALTDTEGVLSYLRQQSALGLDNVRSLVRVEADAILAQIGDFSEADGQFKPGPEEFSALQVLQHLNGGFARSQDRLRTLSSGQPWVPYAPASPGGIPEGATATFADARRAFAEGVDAVMAILDAADGTRGSDLKVRHPQFGEWNWLEWALYSHHVHTHDHVGQLGEIRTALKK